MLRYLYILTIFSGLHSLSGQHNVCGQKTFALKGTICKASLLEKNIVIIFLRKNTVTMGSSVKVFLALKLFYFLISRDAFM